MIQTMTKVVIIRLKTPFEFREQSDRRDLRMPRKDGSWDFYVLEMSLFPFTSKLLVHI